MTCAALLLCTLAFQDPPAGPPVAAEMNDATATEMLEKLNDALKSKDPKERAEAMVPFCSARHKRFVAPLASQLSKGPQEVRVVAARALGAQRYDSARAALLKAFLHKSLEEEHEARAAVAEALGDCEARAAAEEFQDEFDKADSLVKKAIVRAFGRWKDRRNVEFLGKHLEEPQPANVHSPNNPPASYWERRWKEWSAIKDDVRWALKEITGQDFQTEREVKDWVKKNVKRR